MKATTTYECEVCGLQSKDQAEVARCEAVPVKPLGFKLGDVVTSGTPYGWWHADKMDWFLEERGDQASRSHLERAKKGWPLFIVLAIVPWRDTDSQIMGGYAHSESAILYSPKYANRVEGSTFLEFGTPLQKVREVTQEEFAALHAEALAFAGPNSRIGKALAGSKG